MACERMNIALCDDYDEFREAFFSVLHAVGHPDDVIRNFSSGIELLESCRCGYPYDVTFLDIRMPGFSGLETASEIRRISEETVIIIVTEFTEYAIESIKCHPFGYLLKPVSECDVRELLDKARKKERPKELLIRNRGKCVAVPLSRVHYIEVVGRILVVHTTEHVYKTQGQLKDYAGALDAQGFMQIYRSIIVNPDFVRKVDGRERLVFMKNGDELPISRERLSSFLSSYIGRFCGDYLFGN